MIKGGTGDMDGRGACPCKDWMNGARFSVLVGHNENCHQFYTAANKEIETLIKRMAGLNPDGAPTVSTPEPSPAPQLLPAMVLDGVKGALERAFKRFSAQGDHHAAEDCNQAWMALALLPRDPGTQKGGEA